MSVEPLYALPLGGVRGFRTPQSLGCYVTNRAPHKALKLITRCKLTFGERGRTPPCGCVTSRMDASEGYSPHASRQGYEASNVDSLKPRKYIHLNTLKDRYSQRTRDGTLTWRLGCLIVVVRSSRFDCYASTVICKSFWCDCSTVDCKSYVCDSSNVICKWYSVSHTGVPHLPENAPP